MKPIWKRSLALCVLLACLLSSLCAAAETDVILKPELQPLLEEMYEKVSSQLKERPLGFQSNGHTIFQYVAGKSNKLLIRPNGVTISYDAPPAFPLDRAALEEHLQTAWNVIVDNTFSIKDSKVVFPVDQKVYKEMWSDEANPASFLHVSFADAITAGDETAWAMVPFAFRQEGSKYKFNEQFFVFVYTFTPMADQTPVGSKVDSILLENAMHGVFVTDQKDVAALFAVLYDDLKVMPYRKVSAVMELIEKYQ